MILYAVIARAKDAAVLVEAMVAGVEGNFPQITVEVLERIVSTSSYESALGTLESQSNIELLPDGGRRTFVQRHDGESNMFDSLFSGVATQWSFCGFAADNNDESSAGAAGDNGDIDYYFHLCRKDNVICLCISDDIDARYHAVNYDFLDDAHAKFTKIFPPYKVTKAKAYEMDKKFRKELGLLIYFYNENRNKMVRQDKMDDMMNSVDDLKGILGRNITMVLERETRLVELVEISDEMLDTTKVFTRRSTRLKTVIKRKNYTYHWVAFIFGSVVLYLCLGEICGYTFQKCSAQREEGEGR
mmetsp:Transcript_5659/g.10364  ORF Transcript_5659/g.10364 Transcript_5659/m.10364 type:complete len:301 (+) Transcript_5659:118-1020(+)